MKLDDALYKAPEMSEEKFQENVEEIIKQLTFLKVPVFLLKNWTAEDLIKEWELVQLKQSNLTRSQREAVSAAVSMALLNMVKDESEES